MFSEKLETLLFQRTFLDVLYLCTTDTVCPSFFICCCPYGPLLNALTPPLLVYKLASVCEGWVET